MKHNVYRTHENKRFYLYRGREYDVEGLHALVTTGMSVASLRRRLSDPAHTVESAVERSPTPGSSIRAKTYTVSGVQYTTAQLYRLWGVKASFSAFCVWLADGSKTLYDVAVRFGDSEEASRYETEVEARVEATARSHR